MQDDKRQQNTANAVVPTPVDPHARRQPLPESEPKSSQEDRDAPHRLETILNSRSYRQADQDIDFLNRNETRGVRLQLDYEKPQLLLQQNSIARTIVVFGSTRIPEPTAAKRKLSGLEAQLTADPQNIELQARVNRAQRIVAKSHYYEVAREFARLVSQAGSGTGDDDLVVMTGGGPGIMEAANRGAFDVEKKSIGLNINLPQEQFPNPYVTPQLCFRFHYFAVRKLHFLLRTQALVAFPGGYGTFDELFETLTLVQTRTIRPVPIVLVGEAFWREAVNFDFMIDEGVIDEEDRELFWYAESAQDIWQGIQQWHAANRTPLTDSSAQP